MQVIKVESESGGHWTRHSDRTLSTRHTSNWQRANGKTPSSWWSLWGELIV